MADVAVSMAINAANHAKAALDEAKGQIQGLGTAAQSAHPHMGSMATATDKLGTSAGAAHGNVTNLKGASSGLGTAAASAHPHITTSASATEKLGSAASGAHGHVGNLKASTGGLSDVMKNLAPQMLGVAAAMTAAFSISHAIKATTELGGEINKMTRELGLSAEGASKLHFQFQETGISFESGEKSLVKFSKGLAGLADSEDLTFSVGKALKDNIASMGIQFEDSAGKARPITGILSDIAEHFKKMPNGMEKTALSMQLFGKTGAELLPFLNRGKEGLADLAKEADHLGLVLDQKTLDALKKQKMAAREMHAAFEGVQVQIGIAFIPVMTLMAETATKVAVAFNQLVTPAITAVANAVGGLIKAGWDIFTNALGAIKDAIVGLVGGPLGTLIEKFKEFWHEIDGGGAVMAGLATVMTASIIPALVALAPLLAPIIAGLWGIAAAAAANPLVQLAIVIAAIGAAAYLAYTNIQPFHDIVDKVANLINGGFRKAVDIVKEFFDVFLHGKDKLIASDGEFAMIYHHVGLVADAAEKARKFVDALLTPLIALAKLGWDELKKGAGVVADLAESGRRLLEQGWDKLVETLSRLAGLAWEGIKIGAGAISDIASAGVDLAAAGWDAITSSLSGLASLAWDGLVTGAGAIKDIAKAGLDLAIVEWDKIKGPLGDLAGMAWDALKTGAEAVAKVAVAAKDLALIEWEKFVGWVKELAEISWGKMQEGAAALGGLAAKAKELAESGLDKATASVKDFQTSASGLDVSSFTGAFDKVKSAVQPALDVLRPLAENVMKELKTQFDAVKEALGPLGSALKDLGKEFKPIGDAALTLTPLLEPLANYLGAVLVVAIAALLVVVKELVKFFGTILVTSIDVAVLAIKGITLAIDIVTTAITEWGPKVASALGDVIDKFTGFVEDVKGVVSPVISFMFSVGEDIVRGLWNGIKGLWHLVTDGVSALIDKIPHAVRRLMGISSPSKVFYEIGGYIVQGLANGVTDAAPEADAAMTKLMEGNLASYRAGLEAMRREGAKAGGGATSTGGMAATMDDWIATLANNLKSGTSLSTDYIQQMFLDVTYAIEHSGVPAATRMEMEGFLNEVMFGFQKTGSLGNAELGHMLSDFQNGVAGGFKGLAASAAGEITVGSTAMIEAWRGGLGQFHTATDTAMSAWADDLRAGLKLGASMTTDDINAMFAAVTQQVNNAGFPEAARLQVTGFLQTLQAGFRDTGNLVNADLIAVFDGFGHSIGDGFAAMEKVTDATNKGWIATLQANIKSGKEMGLSELNVMFQSFFGAVSSSNLPDAMKQKFYDTGNAMLDGWHRTGNLGNQAIIDMFQGFHNTVAAEGARLAAAIQAAAVANGTNAGGFMTAAGGVRVGMYNTGQTYLHPMGTDTTSTARVGYYNPSTDLTWTGDGWTQGNWWRPGDPTTRQTMAIGAQAGMTGYAAGTRNAPGGMSWVGENGPELMYIPKGAVVHNNDESQAIGGGSTYNITIQTLDATGMDKAVDTLIYKLDRRIRGLGGQGLVA